VPYNVTIKSGLKDVALPNGGIYQAGQVATLTDDQYLKLSSTSSAGTGIASTDPAYTTKLTGAGGLLDRCQLNASWLILTFHQIVTGSVTDPTQCSQADFQTIMAAISSRGIPVVPVGDVIRNYG
jgi:hypothetical protein